MTKQNLQSGNFRFDDTKSFSENCDTFLSCLEIIDAEMAAILRNNWDTLVAIVHDGERNSKLRGEFNSKVAMALDLLVKQADLKNNT